MVEIGRFLRVLSLNRLTQTDRLYYLAYREDVSLIVMNLMMAIGNLCQLETLKLNLKNHSCYKEIITSLLNLNNLKNFTLEYRTNSLGNDQLIKFLSNQKNLIKFNIQSNELDLKRLFQIARTLPGLKKMKLHLDRARVVCGRENISHASKPLNTSRSF